jgi:hypothetical protein
MHDGESDDFVERRMYSVTKIYTKGNAIVTKLVLPGIKRRDSPNALYAAAVEAEDKEDFWG